MNVVKNWLNGKRNYHVGIAIFKTVANNKKLADLFAKGPTDYNIKRLAEELAAIDKEPVKLQSPEIDELITPMPADSNPILQSLREEWLKPYQRMNYLRHKLDDIITDSADAIAVRKDLAFEILELEQQCMQVWAKRRHYEKHGALPNVTTQAFIVPTDPVALGRFIEASKKAIRNNRKKMRQSPDNPLYAQLYQQHKERFKAATGNEYEEKN